MNLPDMEYYYLPLSWYNEDGTQKYVEHVDITKDPPKDTYY
jgi:hypothetical protein